MTRRHLMLAAALVAALATPTVGIASFHGANGRIAVVSNRDGNDEIYTMNPDGSGRLNVTLNPASDVDPRFSPSGARIVFASSRGGDYAIYTMNADGSDVTLVSNAIGNERRPSFTSDGRIVFQGGFFPSRAIYLMNTDGSGLVRLTPTTTDNAWAAPAPHSNRIAFSRYDGVTQSLMTMTEAGGDARAVTSPAAGVSDYQANWSPTGNSLVFIRGDAGGTTHVYTVHVDGTGLHQVTTAVGRLESEPVWSPDGRQLAFHACPGAGAACVVLVAGAGGSTGETDVSTPHAPFLETFSTGIRDPIWHTIQFGTDTSFAQQNGRLEITLGADAVPGPPFGFIEAHYGLNCSLPGDFDIQADYSLLEWPTANGSFAQLAAFFASSGIFRQSVPWGEFYNANSGPVFNTVATTDTSGSFRLVRSGGQMTAYYRDPIFGWTQLLNAPAASDTVVPGVSVSSNDFAHQEVKVAFDNFRISSGTMTCPTWWNDSSPDWQAT